MIPDLLGAPAEGIYSVAVNSEFNGFCMWYTLIVERAPSSSYTPPDGYKLIASSESVSPSGVVLAETYAPSMSLDIQEVILIVPSVDLVPNDGPYSLFAAMNHLDMADVASHALNIMYVMNKFLTIVGAQGSVTIDSTLQSTYIAFGDLFDIPETLIIQLLNIRRVTPAAAMMAIYAGLGLMLKQVGAAEFVLTDINTVLTSLPISVSVSDIVSVDTSYSYKDIAKTQSIHFGPDQGITDRTLVNDDSNLSLSLASIEKAKGLMGDDLMYKKSPGSAMSQAVGSAAHIVQTPVPLVMRSQLKQATVSGDGMATIRLDGVTRTVKLEKIFKVKDSMRVKKDMSDRDEAWNYAAAQVVAKRMFMERLQGMMSFANIQGSSSKNAVVDGVVDVCYGNIFMPETGTSLQKAVVSETSVAYVTEEFSIEGQGFVVGTSTVMQSGLITTTLRYINMAEAYQGIF